VVVGGGAQPPQIGVCCAGKALFHPLARMRLADALRVGPGTVAAFAGAGGKSTAIARLVTELSPELPVVVTTTTHLALPQTSLARSHLIARNPADLEGLPDLLARDRSVLVTGDALQDEPKWTGLDPRSLEALRCMAEAAGAVVLVEADGARGRSLKAPGEHEPAIPSFAGLTVPVVGLDVLGVSLDSGLVHRPERVAGLLNLASGDRIEPGHLARLITDEQGGLKGAPPGSEVRVLLNKFEAGREAEARLVAEAALTCPRVRAVVLANVAQAGPVEEVFGRVAGVVLAAGASARLHQPKQLLPWRGHPLVWHAARAAIDGGLSPVAVVVGAEADAVRSALAGEPVEIVRNDAWPEGQSTSVRAGLEAVRQDVEAIVFLLVDTPYVDSSLILALVRAHRRTLSPIVAPRVGDRWANPVLFDRAAFPALQTISGDRGGRALFDRFRISGVEWDASILLDVDTPDDLRTLGLSH